MVSPLVARDKVPTKGLQLQDSFDLWAAVSQLHVVCGRVVPFETLRESLDGDITGRLDKLFILDMLVWDSKCSGLKAERSDTV